MQPKGRELEIADLLSYLKRRGIRNVVWFTADVHYAAAHYYDPAAASFADFDPFWEFVGGPVNAGTFGPNDLDPTFGPQVRFQKVPPAGQPTDLGGVGLAAVPICPRLPGTSSLASPTSTLAPKR